MAAGIFFLFILLLIIAAWTDLKEGYIPDSVSILIFLLSFYSLFIRSGPGLLLRIEGAVLCGGLLEGIRLISRGGIGMGDVKTDDCLWLLSWDHNRSGLPCFCLYTGRYVLSAPSYF